MCGRFSAVNLDDADPTAVFLKEQAALWPEGGFGFKSGGEVCPGYTAPVMVKTEGAIKALPMRWGFTGYSDPRKPGVKPRLLFNARSETASELRTWSGPLLRGRCLIPCAGFFEWSHEGKRVTQKWIFKAADGDRLFLAGVSAVNPERAPGEAPQVFSILTAAAGPDMLGVHDRTPVCLPRDRFDAWLGEGYRELLKGSLTALAREPA
jgi:putative SOS response-associated peptidase YedK